MDMTINKMIAQAEQKGEQEFADILKGKDNIGPNIVGANFGSFDRFIDRTVHTEVSREEHMQ